MPSLMESFFWRRVDARPYALARMAYAFAALFNWCELWPRRQMYFGPHGMLDLATLRGAIADEPYTSVFFLFTSEAGTTAIMLGALAAIIALGVGVATPLAAFATWAFHLSYSHRAFPVLHSWDAVLRAFGFLVMLSPTGAAWSVDARSWRPQQACRLVPAYGLRLMQIQLLVIYLATVWLKVPDRSWRNGQLLAYFQLSFYARDPDLTLLARHEALSALLTYTSLAVELSVVFLLFARRTRWMGFLLGFGLHVGIAAASNLTVFTVAILAPYFAFLEGRDLEDARHLMMRLRARHAAWRASHA